MELMQHKVQINLVLAMLLLGRILVVTVTVHKPGQQHKVTCRITTPI